MMEVEFIACIELRRANGFIGVGHITSMEADQVLTKNNIPRSD
jgi:hypothetical protein